MKKIIRLILGIAFAILFIWLVFRNIRLDELKKAFDNADWFFIIPAVLAFFVGYSCRIERWRLMLTQENPGLLWRNCSGPLMASVAMNNVLPFRMGDLLRAFGFNRTLKVSVTTSLIALLVERLLDLLMVISFLGLALAYFGMASSHFVGVGGGFLMLAAAAILVLLCFPSILKPMVLGVNRLLSRYLPKVGEKIFIHCQKIFTALEYTSNGHIMLRLVLWSLLAWVAEGLVFWFVALSLPSLSNHLAAWLALSVGTLATIIPSTPGYVGTFDYFTTQAMATLGNTWVGSTAFAFLVHAVFWLPPTLVGGFYLLVNFVKKQKHVK